MTDHALDDLSADLSLGFHGRVMSRLAELDPLREQCRRQMRMSRRIKLGELAIGIAVSASRCQGAASRNGAFGR